MSHCLNVSGVDARSEGRSFRSVISPWARTSRHVFTHYTHFSASLKTNQLIWLTCYLCVCFFLFSFSCCSSSKWLYLLNSVLCKRAPTRRRDKSRSTRGNFSGPSLTLAPSLVPLFRFSRGVHSPTFWKQETEIRWRVLTVSRCFSDESPLYSEELWACTRLTRALRSVLLAYLYAR